MPAITETVAATLEAWAAEGRVLAWPAARALAFDVAATVLVGTRFGSDTIRAHPALKLKPQTLNLQCLCACKEAVASSSLFHSKDPSLGLI